MRSSTTSLLAVLTMLAVAGSARATVVTGQVTNSGGNGIANVDLDFINRDTGQSIPLVNDNTDILGFYAVSVPPGDYDIRFDPPVGQRYVAVELRNEGVAGGSMQLNQELDNGWFVSGRAVRESGVPIPALDLDVNDLIDGGPIYVAYDTTGASGNFQLVLPVGSFSVEFEPPVGSSLVPRLVELSVAGDVALGDVTLQDGFHLDGSVRNPANQPVSGTRVDTLDPIGGLEIFNIRNTTDGVGAYDLVVVPQYYNLFFTPPRGAPLLPRLLGGVFVDGPTSLPPMLLDGGALVTGTVVAGGGSGGGAVEGVDLDFTSSLSGIEQLTPTDNTDDSGQFAVAVMPGTYDINFTPPPGSGRAPVELFDVAISSSMSLGTVQLPPARIVSGVVRDGSGAPLAGVDLDFLDPATARELASSGDFTSAVGTFSAIVAAGTYDIEFSPQDGSGVGQFTLFGVSVTGNVNLGVITLIPSSSATVTSISPNGGTASGGTLVTVMGAGFAPGVDVRVGGLSLTDIEILSSSSVRGVTRAHPAGSVDLSVTNPGAPGVTVTAAFTYALPALDPVLTVSRSGLLGTDVMLDWTSTGQPSYSLFRSTSAVQFGSGSLLSVQTDTEYRDDAAAAFGTPTLLFYSVQ